MESKARVLAVDDQLYFRTLLEGLLQDEGYDVRTAADAAGALALLGAGQPGACGPSGDLGGGGERPLPFDLVVCDLSLPGAGEQDLVRELGERFPSLPVIVLSSVGDVPAVIGAMRDGAADFLQKPVQRERLVHSIEAVLERRRMRRENQRLADENVELFGTLALLERGLAILEQADVDAVAESLLDLLCRELGAEAGLLFLRESLDRPLLLRAGRGDLPFEVGGTTWSLERAESRARASAVERGEPCVTPTGVLLVPCCRAGTLLAVVELFGRAEAELRERDREVCARLGRLGGVALWNASRVRAVSSAALREPRTGLPSLAYLEEALETEVHRAQRFGRRLSLLCVELRALGPAGAMPRIQAALEAVSASVRNTDIVCAEDPLCYFVLATDTDTLGGLVLKRRLAASVREVVGQPGEDAAADLPAIGVASFPVDGETRGELVAAARAGAAREHSSPVHALGLSPRSGLRKIAARSLEQATALPGSFVSDALDVLVGDLRCRPHDRGLLFLAPGPEAQSVVDALASLGEGDAATRVMVALPQDGAAPNALASRLSPAVGCVRLPRDLEPETSWIVRLGEAAPYLLIAGAPDGDGKRPIFHSGDSLLVECATFRLRREIGFGVGIL